MENNSDRLLNIQNVTLTRKFVIRSSQKSFTYYEKYKNVWENNNEVMHVINITHRT